MLHYIVETHHCRQFVAVDNAQLSAFAKFGKERLDDFSVVSLGLIERVRQILILLPGRRLPIGHCISMMQRDKIDPNNAEKLDGMVIVRYLRHLRSCQSDDYEIHITYIPVVYRTI